MDAYCSISAHLIISLFIGNSSNTLGASTPCSICEAGWKKLFNTCHYVCMAVALAGADEGGSKVNMLQWVMKVIWNGPA